MTDCAFPAAPGLQSTGRTGFVRFATSTTSGCLQFARPAALLCPPPASSNSSTVQGLLDLDANRSPDVDCPTADSCTDRHTHTRPVRRPPAAALPPQPSRAANRNQRRRLLSSPPIPLSLPYTPRSLFSRFFPLLLCFVVVLALLWKKRLVQHVGLRIRLGCAPERERDTRDFRVGPMGVCRRGGRDARGGLVPRDLSIVLSLQDRIRALAYMSDLVQRGTSECFLSLLPSPLSPASLSLSLSLPQRLASRLFARHRDGARAQPIPSAPACSSQLASTKTTTA